MQNRKPASAYHALVNREAVRKPRAHFSPPLGFLKTSLNGSKAMSIRGVIAFLSYIVHIYARWTRVTVRRYGVRGVLDSSYRPRRAGMGRGMRANPWGRAHGAHMGGTAVWTLIRELAHERALSA